MAKRLWKSAVRWPQSRTTRAAPTWWRKSWPSYASMRTVWLSVRSAIGVLAIVALAARQGILPLVLDIVRGHPYVLEPDGRLWVFVD